MLALTKLRRAILLAGLLFVATPAAAQDQAKFKEYYGMCEASAAVAVGRDHFLVADDQDSILRLYARKHPHPVFARDLSAALGIPPQDRNTRNAKTDIEGAAAIGNRVYWITGHSEKWRPQRRFFATDVVPRGKSWSIALVGRPYRALREDLLDDDLTKGFLEKIDLRRDDAENGFNIEGLAAAADGKLLIGFRNPVPNGKALLVRLDNPNEVVRGMEFPKFGKVFALDLDGLGIRSIDRVGDAYMIVAGPVADEPGLSLRRWSGVEHEKPAILPLPVKPEDDFRPEALFAIPGTDEVQLLGDEGDVKALRAECKAKDIPKAKKKFRSIVIKP